MNLKEELKKINGLSVKTKLKVVLLDETTLTGFYDCYTAAIDNDPQIASIDLRVDDDIYELYENEIKRIED
jgi:hypothetical protein